jgi:hypothetical protein
MVDVAGFAQFRPSQTCKKPRRTGVAVGREQWRRDCCLGRHATLAPPNKAYSATAHVQRCDPDMLYRPDPMGSMRRLFRT